MLVMLLEKISEDLQQILLYYGPSFLEKNANETIRAGCLVSGNLINNSKDFLLCKMLL
jgi:hypothetical protein